MRQRQMLLCFIIFALALGYVYLVLPSCMAHYAVCIGSPAGDALAPFRYRILQPAIERLFLTPDTLYTPSILYVDTILHMIIMGLTIPALYAWLKRWADPDRAVLSVIIFGAVYLMAYHLYLRALSTSLEVLFVCWALAWVKKPRIVLLAILTGIAALNRETSLIIPAIYAAYHFDQWRTRRYQVACLGLFGIWAGITAGLHVALGPAAHMLGAVGTLEYNLANIPDALFSNLLLVPLGVVVVMGIKTAPAPLRRLAVIAACYMLAIIIGAAWNESLRLILPFLPLVLPLAFFPAIQRHAALS